MTPWARSCGLSASMRLSAPRSLKDAVNCRFSNFSHTSAPRMSDNVRECVNGVLCTCPCKRARAAWMAARSITVGPVRGGSGCLLCYRRRARGLPYRQKIEEQQPLRMVDADAARVFAEQVGDKVQPAEDGAELPFEAEVGGLGRHFVGQQQRLPAGIAARGQQPGGGLDIAGGVVDVLRVEHVGHVHARL